MSDEPDKKSQNFWNPRGVPMLIVGTLGTLVSSVLAVRDMIGWILGGRK